MSKNKSSNKKMSASEKITIPKKSNDFVSVKPGKTPEKSMVSNPLTPLHEIVKCIENDYGQLKKLFGSIPAMIEKNIAATKNKLKKAKENQAKTQISIAAMKKKQNAKPYAKNREDGEKYEKRLIESKAEVSVYDAALKQFFEQLQICKKMQREYTLIDKAIKKVKADVEKKNLR